MQSDVATYGIKLFDAYAELLEQARHSQGVGLVHRWRVRTKRLKALLAFLAWQADSRRSAPPWKKFRKTFKWAGALRDLQVQARLLGAHRDAFPEAVKLLLKSQAPIRKHARQELRRALDNFLAEDLQLLRKDLQLELEQLLAASPREHALAYCRAQLQAADPLTGAGDAEQLHLIRIRLKKALYLVDLFGLAGEFPGKRLKAIDRLQKRLGQWHDRQVLYEYLQPFAPFHPQIEQLSKRIRNELNRRRKEIVRELKNWTDTAA